jgi:hypothetical protein
MRVLLDECLPRRLKLDLVPHEVRTVPEAGWAGKNNGELLALAENSYDVFVTIDRRLPLEQRTRIRSLTVVLLVCATNRYEDLRTLVPQLLVALRSCEPGSVVHVGT